MATLVVGCRSLSEPASKAPAKEPAEPKPRQTAVIEGSVRLAPGHELPSYLPTAMQRKVLAHTEQAPLPDVCPPPKLSDRQPVQLTTDGLLTGVMVGASEFSRSSARPPKVHEVVIEDCRLSPRLVVAVRGDVLRVRNAVNYPFMPMYGQSSLAQTLTPGQSRDVKLDKGGVEPVLCGFTAPCGRTDVVVVYHSLNAITGADGRFRIEGVPADEDFKLNVWHPLFKETTLQVKVGQGEVKSLDMELTPMHKRDEVVEQQAAKEQRSPADPNSATTPGQPAPPRQPAPTPAEPGDKAPSVKP